MSDFWNKVANTTAHLSMTEVGAYRLLLDHYINVGGNCLASEEQLLRVCRAVAKQEQVAAKSVLHQFFKQSDGVWRHIDADALIEKRRRLSKLRAEIGRKGGSKANAKQLLPLSSSSKGRRKKRERGRRGAAETPTPPALTLQGWEAAHPWAVELRAIVGDAAWQAWFADCAAGVMAGELLVPRTFAAEHIQNAFAAQLRTIGDRFNCSVVVKLGGQRVAA